LTAAKPFVLSLSKYRLLASSFDIDPPGDRTNGKRVMFRCNDIPPYSRVA
jgi:hypothetical protein